MHRADLIRAKMGEKNLTRVALAEKTGLNINTISALCRGDRAYPDTLKKIGDALGLTLAELYTPKPERVEELRPGRLRRQHANATNLS